MLLRCEQDIIEARQALLQRQAQSEAAISRFTADDYGRLCRLTEPRGPWSAGTLGRLTQTAEDNTIAVFEAVLQDGARVTVVPYQVHFRV